MDAKTSTEILRREFKTVDKSLGLKPILIDLANEIADFIEQQEEQLEQSQDRERVLQEKLDMLQETHTDNEGNVWEAPTSYAYYTACSALYKHKDRERVLREALEEIKTISSVAEQLTTFYEAESLRSLIESIAIEALEASK